VTGTAHVTAFVDAVRRSIPCLFREMQKLLLTEAKDLLFNWAIGQLGNCSKRSNGAYPSSSNCLLELCNSELNLGDDHEWATLTRNVLFPNLISNKSQANASSWLF
jgi:hypothetical protein